MTFTKCFLVTYVGVNCVKTCVKYQIQTGTTVGIRKYERKLISNIANNFSENTKDTFSVETVTGKVSYVSSNADDNVDDSEQ